MKLRIQIVVVNVLILAGLAVQYFCFHRSSLASTAVTGVLLLAMANMMFLIRSLQKKDEL